MKLKEIMSEPVTTITKDTSLGEAAKIMLEQRIGCLPVIDEGVLTGIITKTDFIAKDKAIPFSTVRAPELFGYWLSEGAEKIYENVSSMRVTEVMTHNPITFLEDDLVKTYLEKIISNNITHAPILRDGSIVGIVARHDLLKMLTS
jgi:CBS domain-containing protein